MQSKLMAVKQYEQVYKKKVIWGISVCFNGSVIQLNSSALTMILSTYGHCGTEVSGYCFNKLHISSVQQQANTVQVSYKLLTRVTPGQLSLP